MQTVLLGVTGCIAAYKACEIVRGLQKGDPGLNIKVVMTEHGAQFVGPTTFRSLTGNEVAVGLFDNPSDPIHHISLAKEADVFCIAPATANVISKIARGQADDLLTTTALATRAPLVVAPAMNTGMWDNPVMQENLDILQARGARVVAPATGYLACGDVGAGRLEDPSVIVAAVLDALSHKRDMESKHVLITAGPTQEPLDPIRYISNLSSGKMGYCIAAECVARGADVTLVAGPTALRDPEGASVLHVRTANEMLEACKEPFGRADVAVFVAAVSDWRPAQTASVKMKRDGSDLSVRFVPNPDIAATYGSNKKDTYCVVFAAETGNPLEAAKGKLVKKNADLCVANDVSEPGMGMGAADNHVWLVSDKAADEVPAANKRIVARAIVDRIVSELARTQ